MQIWYKILPQAEDALNILWTACDDPTKSAYGIFHGKDNFNIQPLELLIAKH